jgi:hypothetical protein
LDPVDPGGHLTGAALTDQVEVAQPALRHQLGGAAREERAVLGEGAVRTHGEHGVEELAGLLLQCHAGEEVRHALVDGAVRIAVRGGRHTGIP